MGCNLERVVSPILPFISRRAMRDKDLSLASPWRVFVVDDQGRGGNAYFGAA